MFDHNAEASHILVEVEFTTVHAAHLGILVLILSENSNAI
jgi:hypothetical protein